MSLLKMILSPNNRFHDIEKHLESQSEEPATLAILLSEKEQDTGKTALHIAVEKGDFDLVKLLLDFDASIDATDLLERTSLDLVDITEKLKTNEEEKVPYKKIAALLRTRKIWQQDADSFLLNRTIRAADKAIGKIKGAQDATATLLVGTTGRGKSTLINCLLGVDYEIYKERREKKIRKKDPSVLEPAKIGETATSETMYPTLYPYQNHLLADMPGYQGNREAEKITVAASTCMISRELNNIQGLVLVCTYEDMKDIRKVSYRENAVKIGRITMHYPELINNIVLAVTRKEILDADDEEELVELMRNKLNELMEADDLKNYPTEIDTNSCQDQEFINKVAVKRVTKALLQTNKIIIADVAHENTRQRFREILNNVQPIEAKKFDFSDFDGDMHKFMKVMIKIVEFHGLLNNRLATLGEKKEKFEFELKETRQLKEEKILNLNQLLQERRKPFDITKFDEKINYNEQSQVKLAESIKKLQELLNKNNEKKAQIESEKENIRKYHKNLEAQKKLAGKKAAEHLKGFDQQLHTNIETLENSLNEVIKKIERSLLEAKARYKNYMQQQKKIKEEKQQQIANHAQIQANSGPMIEALEGEIAMLEKQIDQLILFQQQNNIELEKSQYEFDVNKSFFEKIITVFNILNNQSILWNNSGEENLQTPGLEFSPRPS